MADPLREERAKLWAMLQRCNAIGDRNAATICANIQTRTNLGDLDRLFDFGHRQHLLFMRIHKRYEATLPALVEAFK